jgi:RNA polymerase-binding transcription factor DksA
MTSTGESKTTLTETMARLLDMDRIACTGTTLISDALERISNETYGFCAECQQRISPKRLAALPWVKYCVACQDAKDDLASEVRWKRAA